MAYDAASTGRRMVSWQPTRVGPTTVLWNSLDLMRARSREEVRNNPWAASAIDNFEAQYVGKGIRPHWNVESPKTKAKIEKEFSRWATATNFYGLQSLAARELFNAGEVFTRFHSRPSSWGLRIPFECELIAGEQCPIWLNYSPGGVTAGTKPTDVPSGNAVRAGIEFDPLNRRTAYHMYRNHPGEMMFYPSTGLTYIRIPASEIVHTYKPLAAGQLRGQPALAATLVTLHELDKYSDAAVVKKQIQTMFAGFIEKLAAETDILPPYTGSAASASGLPSISGLSAATPPGVKNSLLETGTFTELLPGEKITFPQLPQDNDIETFYNIHLHRFAVGVGATYEQITGDLRGVNLSSIRAGILDFRRKCEQFQLNILIGSFLQQIVYRWLDELFLSGLVSMPGYAEDPILYRDISWSLPGWPWIDPLTDAESKQLEVQCGFTSREAVVAEKGEDVSMVDQQQVSDHEREDSLGLVYAVRPDKIPVGKTNVEPKPKAGSESGAGSGSESESESSGPVPVKKKKVS